MAQLSASQLTELRKIVGEEHARETNGRVAVFPASTEEVSALLKFANAQKLVVTATGGGTKLAWGAPVATQLELHTSRLNGVLEHSWGDLTATVAAGTPWSSMQETLAQHGQRVALDPAHASHATVGGVLATNDSGTLRMRYGSLRDLVIGMTIVLADGTIARAGGKVVKNVAGYDLPKLLTGSFGTLGIITEATFRLHAVQPHVLTFTVRSTDIAALADLMSAVLKTGLSLEQMQLRTEALNFALDLQLASVPESLAEQEQQLRALAPSLSFESADADIFSAREKLFGGNATVLKIMALSTKLAAIVAGVAALSQLPDYEAACVADPVGIVTVRLSTAPEQTRDIVADLRERLASSGGAVVTLENNAGLDPWGASPAAIDVMRSIKQEFDPQRILNPGKFVGGI